VTPEAEALDRLAHAPWLRARGVQKLFRLFDGAKGRTRAVGGAVRDTLLGMVRDDLEVDFATELTPDEVMGRARASGVHAIPTGIAFGTVTLVIDGGAYEVTTLRQDVETDGRRARVAFGTDWRADAERRDFTLNALYCGPEGQLFDPLGGLDDCLARRVRFIGDARARIEEDRLRVYRFFRFSASHGGEAHDPDGLAAVQSFARDLAHVSAERVGHEMVRMLGLAKIARTLEVMRAQGILLISAGTAARLAHYEAVAGEALAAARLALLIAERPAGEVQQQWRLPNALTRQAEEMLSAALLLVEGKLAHAAYRHRGEAVAAVPVAAALAGWDAAETKQVKAAVAELDPPPFPIKGRDLIAAGIAAGPGVGATLAHLEEAWIASNYELGREQLLAMASEANGPDEAG